MEQSFLLRHCSGLRDGDGSDHKTLPTLRFQPEISPCLFVAAAAVAVVAAAAPVVDKVVPGGFPQCAWAVLLL